MCVCVCLFGVMTKHCASLAAHYCRARARDGRKFHRSVEISKSAKFSRNFYRCGVCEVHLYNFVVLIAT